MRIKGVVTRRLGTGFDGIISVISADENKSSALELLDQAGLGAAGLEIVCDLNPGELTFRTPEVAAKAEKDTALLKLLCQMYGSREQQDNLAGKAICLQWAEPNIPEFLGRKQAVIEGKIVGVNPGAKGSVCFAISTTRSCHILRPCDLVTATFIEIDLDTPPPGQPPRIQPILPAPEMSTTSSPT